LKELRPAWEQEDFAQVMIRIVHVRIYTYFSDCIYYGYFTSIFCSTVKIGQSCWQSDSDILLSACNSLRAIGLSGCRKRKVLLLNSIWRDNLKCTLSQKSTKISEFCKIQFQSFLTYQFATGASLLNFKNSCFLGTVYLT
jgi:hypothetical protein